MQKIPENPYEAAAETSQRRLWFAVLAAKSKGLAGFVGWT
jgi:hypothetical protein